MTVLPFTITDDLSLAFKDLTLVEAKHAIDLVAKLQPNESGARFVVELVESCSPLRQKSLIKHLNSRCPR